MCLVGINLFTTSNVFAADYGNKFITGHELTDDLGNPKTDFGIYDDVQAHLDFDIPVGSVSQGDTMSVNVPEMKFVKEEMEGSIFPYGFVQTSAELDDTVIKLQKVLDNLLSLAEIEKSCQLMADEIEKTRRRVNALEYSTIPNLEETVKDIRMKLDENERATITRLMKVKQMLEKNA